jgi:hypothetical protein
MRHKKTISTIRGLFIIESLSRRDEKLRRDGFIIEQILCLSGMPVKYIYIRTKSELSMALTNLRDQILDICTSLVMGVKALYT